MKNKTLTSLVLAGTTLFGQGCKREPTAECNQRKIQPIATFSSGDLKGHTSVVLGDMNNDGLLDIVYSSIRYVSTDINIPELYVLYNKGDGTYTPDFNSLKPSSERKN